MTQRLCAADVAQSLSNLCTIAASVAGERVHPQPLGISHCYLVGRTQAPRRSRSALHKQTRRVPRSCGPLEARLVALHAAPCAGGTSCAQLDNEHSRLTTSAICKHLAGCVAQHVAKCIARLTGTRQRPAVSAAWRRQANCCWSDNHSDRRFPAHARSRGSRADVHHADGAGAECSHTYRSACYRIRCARVSPA